jgi:hypothetical protein
MRSNALKAGQADSWQRSNLMPNSEIDQACIPLGKPPVVFEDIDHGGEQEICMMLDIMRGNMNQRQVLVGYSFFLFFFFLPFSRGPG